MDDAAKYLIHADVTASGVVEREDVVGAVYGQTEGLLGDELDLRYLQESSKVGRIDVEVQSEGGRSFGELTIATSMDRVETAVLAAALETIGRVGPCRADFRVSAIEDVRAAKRREVVERAKELLAESFDAPAASSDEILEEVRRAVRVEDITEYEGLPGGPNVADSDAVIVVEGRADVLTLLEYGIKNAVAVEGTDVPDAVAELTGDRTVTAFLDGDRGGDLILRELAQVGEIDHVALAPPDRSVEDLERREVMAALRGKVPYEQLVEGDDGAPAPTDGGTIPADVAGGQSTSDPAAADETAPPAGRAHATSGEPTGADATASSALGDEETRARDAALAGVDPEGGPVDVEDATEPSGSDDPGPAAATDAEPDAVSDEGGARGEGTDAAGTAGRTTDTSATPETLPAHVEAVVGEGTGSVRLLDGAFAVLAEADAADAFDVVEAADPVPDAVVLDGTLTQRLLDVVAQRGVGQVVARETGDLVKQPAGVRIRTADQFQ